MVGLGREVARVKRVVQQNQLGLDMVVALRVGILQPPGKCQCGLGLYSREDTVYLTQEFLEEVLTVATTAMGTGAHADTTGIRPFVDVSQTGALTGAPAPRRLCGRG